MIAFFNPKILIFFVAIFSQFIKTDMSIADRLIIAIMAGIIDTTWYVLVALMLAGTSLIEKIRMNGVVIDRSIGSILIVVAILLIVKTMG
jgi:threonine/homoserine/homoserine lactone efflux protein